jgi:epoxyqueuosine reductase
LVGVTTCEPLPHADVYESWLASGRQGEMGYLATSRSRECRAYPARLLPECRCVVVLGTRYPAPLRGESGRQSETRGQVASYAWGVDYHEFLPERLQSLVQFIEDQAGCSIPNRVYTDTGPILERELGMRAGLGWIGKNTCLVNPHRGSYFLLAEILLGLELEPDLPFTADRCGTCTRCIEACPTGCIQPDRTLDARHCISYLTIELKGSIPEELRPRMGAWVFGCDVCQQVCPWNRFATAEVDRAFAHRLVAPDPDLLGEIALTTGEFNQHYRHSPIQRPKRRGYLRNVAVALGNAHASSAIPALAQALETDPEPLIRSHTAWALGRIGLLKARLALLKAARNERDAQVLAEIEKALAYVK